MNPNGVVFHPTISVRHFVIDENIAVLTLILDLVVCIHVTKRVLGQAASATQD